MEPLRALSFYSSWIFGKDRVGARLIEFSKETAVCVAAGDEFELNWMTSDRYTVLILLKLYSVLLGELSCGKIH